MPRIDHTRLLRSKTAVGEVLARKSAGGIWRSTSSPVTYQRVVVIGASIMNGLAGNNLTTPHAGSTTALGMDVYGGSTAGETLSEQIDNVQAAIAAFPTVGETVFLVHSGGNDVSAHMPFDAASPATLDTMRANLNALLDAFGAHLPHVVAMPPSFRSYTGQGYATRELFNDQMRGALGFNEAVFKPIYQTRIASRWRYADGESVMCFYDLVRNNFEDWLTDGIHIAWTAGRRAALLDRLEQALAGTTPTRIIPDPVDPAGPAVNQPATISPSAPTVGDTITITAPTWTGDTPITITMVATMGAADVTADLVAAGGGFTYLTEAEGEFSITFTATNAADPVGVTDTEAVTVGPASSTQDVTFLNFVSAAVGTPGMNEYVISQANGITSGPAINLLTFEGVDTGWNYHPESPDGVTPTNQIGANATTIDGGTAFDGTTIYCLEAFDTTLFTTHPNNIVHVFDGLTPGGSYELQFVGSRSGATVRTSRFQVEGGAFVDAISNANPPTSTAIVEATADGSGRIRVLQSSQSATFSYVSGISITELAPPAAIAPRTASTATTRHVGNGHSLVDTTFYGGDWPGDLMEIRNAVLDPNDDPGAPVYIVKDTIPGSRLRWRWETTDPQAPKLAFNFPELFETLVTVEGGPPAHDSTPYFETEFLDFLCRWTAHMIENGAGNDVCLQTIWPSVNGVNAPSPTPPEWQPFASFVDGLPEYGRVHEHAADYVTWKMHQLYTLPAGWRVWVFPGHQWFQRILADVATSSVPGITSHLDLFRDDIHPNFWGEWGLTLFMYSCLYQTDLSGNAAVEALAPADLPVGLHDYFCAMAMEVAEAYPRAGLAGMVTDLQYDPATDADPMPLWTLADPTTADLVAASVVDQPSILPLSPVNGDAIALDFGSAAGTSPITGTYTLTENGVVVQSGSTAGGTATYDVAGVAGQEIVLTVTWDNAYGEPATATASVTIAEEAGAAPEFLLSATAADYSALSGFTGTQPVIENGAMRFTPVSGTDFAVLRGPLPASTGAAGGYTVSAVRCDPVPSGRVSSITMLSSVAGIWWEGSVLEMSSNGYISGAWRAGANGMEPITTAAQDRAQTGVYSIVEVWTDTTNVYLRVNGGPTASAPRAAAYVPLTHLHLFDANGTGSSYYIAALGVMDGVPTEAEMTAARAWAEAQVPA